MATDREHVSVLEADPTTDVALVDGQFVSSGATYRTIMLDRADDTDWWRRQHASLDSYRTEHEDGDIDPTKLATYELFGAYILGAAFRQGSKRPVVLDVGCGIFPTASPALSAVENLACYIGLDPLPTNIERSYPFVCGRLEDLAKLRGFAGRIDLFVFGTSLDHLEDLSAAAEALKRLAAPGALLVAWNGLYEPENVLTNNAVLVFRKVVGYRNRLVAAAAYFGYGVARLPRQLAWTRRRRADLAAGTRLDQTHFRWFTEENSRTVLSAFGEVVDFVVLPNSNHSFATVRVEI